MNLLTGTVVEKPVEDLEECSSVTLDEERGEVNMFVAVCGVGCGRARLGERGVDSRELSSRG